MDQAENRVLTECGPGTPGGLVLRSYRQPAASTEELAGERPLVPVVRLQVPHPGANRWLSGDRRNGIVWAWLGRGEPPPLPGFDCFLYRRCWGEETVDYLVAVKSSEWRRFQSAVTDWEQREYGALF
jgi:hypothetical protein